MPTFEKSKTCHCGMPSVIWRLWRSRTNSILSGQMMQQWWTVISNSRAASESEPVTQQSITQLTVYETQEQCQGHIAF